MGIYLPNMEMPKNCLECPLVVCLSVESDCPLVPVPSHGDLIDRDELIKGEGRYIISFGKEGIDVAEINRAPTIIQASEEET